MIVAFTAGAHTRTRRVIIHTADVLQLAEYQKLLQHTAVFIAFVREIILEEVAYSEPAALLPKGFLEERLPFPIDSSPKQVSEAYSTSKVPPQVGVTQFCNVHLHFAKLDRDLADPKRAAWLLQEKSLGGGM